MSERLEVRGLSTRWGDRPVLRDVSFDVAAGEFVVLMGPNGSGKTTLLRALAGLEPVVGGQIVLGTRRLESLPTHRRRVGLLFQEPVMLPRRNVWQNVAYGAQLARRSDAEVDGIVGPILERLRLQALAERSAIDLSGGERQRVALARTLAAEPELLLLDEPFASVDPELRGELRAEFRRVIGDRGLSTVLVTHDREEGLFLADRVLLLLDGRIVQAGRPAEVMAAPAGPAAARFLGYNLVRADGAIEAVLPTELEVVDVAGSSAPATVEAASDLGALRLVYLRGPAGEHWESRTTGASGPVPRAGSPVGVRWRHGIRLPPGDRESSQRA